ncbi:MAG: 1-acyl-sn-glycerol-3-phosphate acyltransferase [Bacteroidales bacterium]|nr:1-acyl-sn-glycerol-3-phosphate acyltransferase [Bacteroidales bacterium]
MDPFDDIRPYNDEEAPEAYRRVMEDPRFQDAMRKCLPDYSVEDLKNDMVHYHTIDEVQAGFIRRWIETFVNQYTTGYTFSGMENTSPDNAYLYIGNHRDITFDPAMLEFYFFIEKRKTSKIAVGDNLINTPVLGDVARLNKMILVKRSGTLREKLANSHQLAAYIQKSLFEEHESVWIAQRDGRTKDGHDFTKQGLLKMVTMGFEKDLMPTIKKLNITPLTISYEYEPCDRLKAREMALSENGPYQKQPGEDFESIKTGIFSPKGHITMTIGKPLQEELNDIPAELNNNDKLYQVCQLIDKQIYQNYHLYPNNYIANDLMHQSEQYAGFYTPEQKEQFVQYLNRKAVVQDVSREKMMHYLLRIYGTPVDNHYQNTVHNQQ